MDETTGLILEGGAMRSVFSAGVLDRLMEEGIQIPNVLAVSAGAYAGMNYVSGQKGRIVTAVIDPLKEYKYLGFRTFLRKGTFFDMDYLFKEVPKTRAPYDFRKLKEYKGKFITSTVNMITGENIYHDTFRDEDEFFQICQAANSMPLIAKISQVDGIPMLDGGMADAIPVQKALEEGWNKIVIVLTRDAAYRKKPKANLYMTAIKLVYRKYPEFLKLIEERAQRYNEALDKIIELKKQGKAFVFRPSSVTVGNSESNVDTLMKYYRHGFDTATERMEELKKFLGS